MVTSVEEELTLFTPSSWTDVAPYSVPVVFNDEEFMVEFNLLDGSQVEEVLRDTRGLPPDERVIKIIKYRLAIAIQSVNGTPLEDILPVAKGNSIALIKVKKEWAEHWKEPLYDALRTAYRAYADSFVDTEAGYNNDPFTEPSLDLDGN